MKVGSIVVVKPMPAGVCLKDGLLWLPVMDEKTPYMIRNIGFCSISNCHCAMFEEGIIGHNALGDELGIPLSQLREILPPDEVNIEETLEETMVC